MIQMLFGNHIKKITKRLNALFRYIFFYIKKLCRLMKNISHEQCLISFCNLNLKTSRCYQHPTSNLRTFGKALAIYVALKATC